MTSDELGPMPEPTIEPREPNPGGVDAITGAMEVPTVPDLDPRLNPDLDQRATPNVVPEPVGESGAEAAEDS